MSGIRVLEVAQWWFVPAAGAVLADWGAEVIKVEHPVTGDPQRGLMRSGLMPDTGGVNYMMEQSNRGKRSIGIDLATEGGRALLYRLAETADVFLTNFLPAARAKLKIDLEDIRAINPNIIYVRGSGHGVRGPDIEKGGYDAASFWSRGGVGNALTPRDAEAPVMQRAAFGDSAGAMTIAGGIAGALFKRERTGEPTVVDVSLFGTAMWLMAPDIVLTKLLEVANEGKPKDAKKVGMPNFTRKNMPNPIVNAYRTADKRWIFLNMLQPDRYWADLCEHLGRPELITDDRYADGMARFTNAEACVAELDATFASRTLDEWREAMATVEGVWAPMQNFSEIHRDPQAIANGYLPEVEAADGSDFTLVASPVQFDESPVALTPAPEHGQHTEEVLLELGLTWEDIAAHKESGAIL